MNKSVPFLMMILAGAAQPLLPQTTAGPYPGITLGTQPTPLPASPAPGSVVTRQESPFFGSVPAGEATGEEIHISLSDAIERGLGTNLGLLLRDFDSREAEAQRKRALSPLLPQLGATVRHQTGEVSVVTFGFSFPGLPTVIGPFSYQDARLELSTKLLDLEALRGYQSARESAKAAGFTLQDARDTVVLAVGAAYFQIQALSARVETTRAQLKASQALEDLAGNRVKAGLTPAIDSFRSTVQRQTDEQRLAVAQANLEKQKLSLARIIGLPPAQRFTITTGVGFEPWKGPDQQSALELAYRSRNDLKSFAAAVRAAELARQAAQAQRLPSLGVSADYGQVGKNLAAADGTFTFVAALSLPLYTGGRIAADVARAGAELD
nr:TolC family protein [Acidobacteriota bacterium]